MRNGLQLEHTVVLCCAGNLRSGSNCSVPYYCGNKPTNTHIHTNTRILQVEHDAIGIARHAICGGHMRASELMLDDYFRC